MRADASTNETAAPRVSLNVAGVVSLHTPTTTQRSSSQPAVSNAGAKSCGRAPKTDGLTLLQKLYFDTALSTSEFVFGALREFVPMSQVLFGSDFPYVTPAVLQAEKYGLESSKVLDDVDRAAIDRDNALALFPRFAVRSAKFAGMS